MHQVTERVLNIMWQLESVYAEMDPDFALLLSFQEARELYHDLGSSGSFEVHTYLPVNGEVQCNSYVIPLQLSPPPYPDGKRVVWAQCEGLKIAIKGTEEA